MDRTFAEEWRVAVECRAVSAASFGGMVAVAGGWLVVGEIAAGEGWGMAVMREVAAVVGGRQLLVERGAGQLLPRLPFVVGGVAVDAAGVAVLVTLGASVAFGTFAAGGASFGLAGAC